MDAPGNGRVDDPNEDAPEYETIVLEAVEQFFNEDSNFHKFNELCDWMNWTLRTAIVAMLQAGIGAWDSLREFDELHKDD